jgi:tRNA (cmo5U34)-methyltransferase
VPVAHGRTDVSDASAPSTRITGSDGASVPTVAQLFDAGARDYDRLRRGLVPCFDDFYGAALDAARIVPEVSQASGDGDGGDSGEVSRTPRRVLDLGAGTGLMSALFAEAFPEAHFTLVDVADAMLARARERFREAPFNTDAEKRRFTFHTLDYAHAPLPGGPYDLVISGLSIHHVSDPAKRALFRRVFEALAPGGAFVNADQVLATTPALQAQSLTLWRRQATAARVTPAQLAEAEGRMRADRPATLEAQLRWLRTAGFQHVDAWYRNGMFTVFAGYSPAAQSHL